MAYLVHEIFQRTGLPPDEFWNKPEGARIFMLASMLFRLEQEARKPPLERAVEETVRGMRRRG